MANFERLAMVTPNGDDSMIRVRVENVWSTLDVENGEGLSFLVVDDEGTRMHAFVQHFADAKRFKRLLQKGDWFTITGFSVVIVRNEIRMTKQRKEIVLKRNTEVGVSELFNGFIPLDLVPFQDVKNGTVHDGTSYTRDFLGVISSVSDFGLTVDDSMPRNIHNYDPKTTGSIDFVLEDNDGNHLNCREKGILAVLFKRNWLCYGETGTNICLLTNWRVVGRDGPIQVEDEEGISTFEYDPPGHHEVVHFTNIFNVFSFSIRASLMIAQPVKHTTKRQVKIEVLLQGRKLRELRGLPDLQNGDARAQSRQLQRSILLVTEEDEEDERRSVNARSIKEKEEDEGDDRIFVEREDVATISRNKIGKKW
ncbi:unnamed protein product [Microthlaspi erraticum]|uniref:Replication protein A 70 kDa DNA-binding subunit B/D first OB fold domain-containing protein n=1 Tax=Microthlaspi erraticum TaxID=1685480 RepID=A0A6D2LBM7_9BRAS|nr:unnamed protein product [Microthlaspi erraticum]